MEDNRDRFEFTVNQDELETAVVGLEIQMEKHYKYGNREDRIKQCITRILLIDPDYNFKKIHIKKNKHF